MRPRPGPEMLAAVQPAYDPRRQRVVGAWPHLQDARRTCSRPPSVADFPLVLVLVVAWLVVALAVTLIVVGIRERRGSRPFAPTPRPRRRRP